MSGTVFVDGEAVEFVGERNMLEVALEHGADLPYFCWHPELGSVGACRQCAVRVYEDADDHEGKIAMACMTAAAPGLRVNVKDEEAKQMRASVVEWLMINHPHDCPVCDEGGECHLQDMTVMAGHVRRRYRFHKRTYRNQDLGPLVNHEMNRCIQCYRCVRFYDDYAGGHDLQAFGAHDHVYFGRVDDGSLESPFAGNLIEVCPTGVFTDKREKTRFVRKWDLQSAPSICVHCGTGCNITPGERDGELRRVRNRFHSKVNGYFICDRGRFGPHYVEGEQRVLNSRDHRGRPLDPVRARERLETWLRDADDVIGIGSPRASLESNYALQRRVGADNYFSGASPTEHELTERILDWQLDDDRRLHTVAPRELAECDAVLVLGENVWETAPIVGLALRQSASVAPRRRVSERGVPSWHARAIVSGAQGERGNLFMATSSSSPLDEVACGSLRGDPAALAAFGQAVARGIDPRVPIGPTVTELDPAAPVDMVANALLNARRPAVVTGTGARSPSVIEAATNIAWALAARRPSHEPTRVCYVLPESNSAGVGLLRGRSLTDLDDAVSESTTLVVLQNDLFERIEPSLAERISSRARQLVVIDEVETSTVRKSHLTLPAATFLGAHGHRTSFEGRVQRHHRVWCPRPDVRPAWRWLVEDRLELTDLTNALEAAHPVFAGALEGDGGGAIPRMTHRVTGRTARQVHLRIHEQPPPVDRRSAYRHSMEGDGQRRRPARLAYYRAPGWTSEQALNRFQDEIGGPLRGGEPGVRLFDTHGESRPATKAPPYFELALRPAEKFLHHGLRPSDELSRRSPPLIERDSKETG